VTHHITDRRLELAGIVHRALLRAALGESYTYEIIPMVLPNQAGGVAEIGYVLAIATKSPLIGQGYITIISQPFTWMAGEDLVTNMISIMLTEIRSHVSKILSEANGKPASPLIPRSPGNPRG
jgi:hypothetical protein